MIINPDQPLQFQCSTNPDPAAPVITPESEDLAYEYNAEPDTEHELAFRDYQFEKLSENKEWYAPLITLSDLRDFPDLEEEWYVPDWIPVGGKTILSAEPKTGKTILLFHMLNAVTNGLPFLGKECPPTRVLYLTEQTEHEFKRQCKEVPGLLDNDNFYVLLAEATPENIKTWDDLLNWCAIYLNKIKAKILVIDTFGGLAKLPPNGENDAATIQNHINKLSFLFKQRYLSVVMTHHNRKPGVKQKGDYGAAEMGINSARGSSAFVGGGGHLLFMDAPDGVKNPYRRVNIFGRYSNGDERSLYLIDGKYRTTQFNFKG